ncbi:hypothetical protein 65p394 [Aeromonas phage 65]|uniref:Uncharacterized protein n=2 Tax=Ishigurovirus osborne TaxID=260149 RepID=A0A219YCN4_9CAUD|nr:hypothetical protein ST65p394 [Aeromonas phage 65]ADQ53401.1 hypothetical protein 65p394 [Aeromonas phage 65]APU01758.1 hypothetical protein [Aeromonas phage 65.2]
MTNVQVFFSTRSNARAASFGKMTDNGTTSEKRWARTVEVQPTKKETLTLSRTGRRGGSVTTTVITKKSKTLVL